MSTNISIQKLYDFTIQQVMAESYWEKYVKMLSDSTYTLKELEDLFMETVMGGNSKDWLENRETGSNLPGAYTRLTCPLAEEAFEKYEFIDHHPNDSTGLSATLIKIKGSDPTEYSLLVRSTEIKLDKDRDAWGADMEIHDRGFSINTI